MVVSEHNMKRKIELEDITNTNTNYNKKLKHYKFQQRSPSPLEMSSDISENVDTSRSNSSSPKKSQKFGKNYKSVSFENSPLLTPKEEIYDEIIDIHHDDNENPEAFDVSSPNSISNDFDEKSENDVDSKLSSNPDYLALTSALRLLNNNKAKIESEINQLSNLFNYYSNLPTNKTKPKKLNKATNSDKITKSKVNKRKENRKKANDGADADAQADDDDNNDEHNEITNFFVKLINNELNLPRQHKILKSPIVNWSKYNINQSSDEFKRNLNDMPLFKTLNLFNN